MIDHPTCETCPYRASAATWDECRRMPPTAVRTDRTTWPRTSFRGWCGEHPEFAEPNQPPRGLSTWDYYTLGPFSPFNSSAVSLAESEPEPIHTAREDGGTLTVESFSGEDAKDAFADFSAFAEAALQRGDATVTMTVTRKPPTAWATVRNTTAECDACAPKPKSDGERVDPASEDPPWSGLFRVSELFKGDPADMNSPYTHTITPSDPYPGPARDMECFGDYDPDTCACEHAVECEVETLPGDLGAPVDDTPPAQPWATFLERLVTATEDLEAVLGLARVPDGRGSETRCVHPHPAPPDC